MIVYIHSNSFHQKLKIDNVIIFYLLIYIQLTVVGALRGKLYFSSPSGFEIQSDFDDRTSKIKFYSVEL